MRHPALLLAAALLAAPLALAHTGVTNPAVLARMDAMTTIEEANKVMGLMMRGARPFDAADAQAAAARIVETGRTVPALFEALEDDPMSEALPAIWETWPDFVALNAAMIAAAEELRTVEDPEALRTGFMALGETCRACHTPYRE